MADNHQNKKTPTLRKKGGKFAGKKPAAVKKPGMLLASAAAVLLIVAVVIVFAATLSPRFRQKFPVSGEVSEPEVPAETEDNPVHTGPRPEVAIPEEPEIPPYFAPELFSWSTDGWPTLETETLTTVRGIDVSDWQGTVDWNAVAADGIEFVLLRVGYRGYGAEGTMRPDTYFADYLHGAKAAGLKVGVYFFSQATNAEEAKEEADYVLEALDGEGLELPVFLDWEVVKESGSRTMQVSGADIAKCCNAFVKEMEKAGYTAGAYLNQHLLDDVIGPEWLKAYPLWVAQYSNTPDCTVDHTFWQFTDSGSVAGIHEKVDLDVMFIAKADLEAWRAAVAESHKEATDEPEPAAEAPEATPEEEPVAETTVQEAAAPEPAVPAAGTETAS